MKIGSIPALSAIAVVLSASAAFCQSPGTEYHSQAELQARSQQLLARAAKNSKGSGNSTLGSYPNDVVQFNVNTKSGISEMHAHTDDLIIVTDGEATILTGGTIPNSNLESEGETRGLTIAGGHEQKLTPGDEIHIPPNTPHQILLAPGKTVSFFNIKVTQP